jgi:hypothetical protein
MASSDLAATGLLLAGIGGVGIYLYAKRRLGGSTATAKVPGVRVSADGVVRGLPSGKGYTGGIALTPLQRLMEFAEAFGFHPTKGQTTGGRHTRGSLHYQGRAIDLGTRDLTAEEIKQIIQAARDAGFRVLNEPYTGQGRYGPSSGPHIHLEVPIR